MVYICQQKKEMEKFTMRYKAGDLQGMLVIKAETKEQAETKLWEELKNNHTKLPDGKRTVTFIQDSRARFTGKINN